LDAVPKNIGCTKIGKRLLRVVIDFFARGGRRLATTSSPRNIIMGKPHGDFLGHIFFVLFTGGLWQQRDMDPEGFLVYLIFFSLIVDPTGCHTICL
jgi:hypothetical protein